MLEDLGTVLADIIGRLGMQEDHVPPKIGLFVGRLATKDTLEDSFITIDKHLNDELHDILT